MADPLFNAAATIELMEAGRRAAERDRAVPRARPVGLLVRGPVPPARAAGRRPGRPGDVVLRASERLPLVAVVGLPLQVDQLLYNCAAVVHRGRLLGLVPKTYLPNYREFYEARQFTPGERRACARASTCAARPTCRSGAACCSVPRTSLS